MQSPPPTFAFSSAPQSTPPTEIDESTPFIAASDGDLLLLQRSIQHFSGSITIQTLRDMNGLTPLHSASSYNQIEVMRWLFTQNVNVDAGDNDGDTPLHHCDNVEALTVLIEEGRADFTVKNNDGQNVLEMKEEELREYYSSRREEEEDSDDEDLDNLKKIIQYLRRLS